MTFIVAACVGLATRAKALTYPVVPVIVYGVFTILVAQDLLLPFQIKSALADGYVSPYQALNRHHSAATDADLIVTLRLPDLTPTVDGFASLYYPKGKTVLNISTAPYGMPDTIVDLKRHIASQKAGSCVVDFTSFQTRQDLLDFVDQTFPVEYRFGSVVRAPDTVQRPGFDPSVKNYLLGIFQPGRYVPC